MRITIKRMVMAIAAVAVLGVPSVFASTPVPSTTEAEFGAPAFLSERASNLLAEIQKEAVALGPHADTLGSFAWNTGLNWETHGFYLHQIRGHINAVGERIAELQRIRHFALPWQQQAITEVTSQAAQLAASAQAAIVHLNGNHDLLFAPEYTTHLTTIAERSDDMKQIVDRFLNYEKAQQRFLELQNQLDRAGD